MNNLKLKIQKLAVPITVASALLFPVHAIADSVSDKKYDLVIVGGRVMDPESNFDGIRNVGIKNGKIAIITSETITGAKQINAKNHVVAPGFIEGHQHGTDPFSRKVSLRDGLTTSLDLESGAGNVGKWYADAKGKTQVNYGMVVNAAFARLSVLDGPEIAALGNDTGDLLGPGVVYAAAAKAKKENRKMGWSHIVSSQQQLEKILAYIDEGLRQGAIGTGIPVGYMKDGITQYEMFKYQEITAQYNRVSNGHTRFVGVMPPSGGMLGVQEMLANAMILDAPFLAAHLNSIQDWEYSIPLINAAKKRGAKVWGEVYPYGAASTIAASAILNEDQLPLIGITYSDIRSVGGKPWDKASYDYNRKNNPGSVVIVQVNPEEQVGEWISTPGVVIVSDGMPVQNAKGEYYPWDSPYEGKSVHPRASGTRAKVLRLVREQNVMPLMEAISKMSYLHAKYMEEFAGVSDFRYKGRMQQGADADIVIFDPATVTDNATFNPGEGTLPSTGIPYVLVNGTVVVENSKVQKVFPGKPIRFPVQETGKLDQIEISVRK